jgi:hypothetical protein
MECAQKASTERKDREINKQSFNISGGACLITTTNGSISGGSITGNISESSNGLISESSFGCFFGHDPTDQISEVGCHRSLLRG